MLAKRFTAFGATKMLERELAEVEKVRKSGYLPTEAQLQVAATRTSRKTRGQRVAFDYELKFANSEGEETRNAQIEVAEVAGDWKVVLLVLQ